MTVNSCYFVLEMLGNEMNIAGHFIIADIQKSVGCEQVLDFNTR